MTVNEAILDAETEHSIGLDRLSRGTVRKIMALLNRIDARLIQRLSTASDLSRARQEQLLSDIRAIVDSVYTDAMGQLQIDLNALAKYEVEFQVGALDGALPIRFDVVTPSEAQILAAVNSRPFQGRLLREWFTELPADAFKKLRDTIRMGFVEGRTIDQIIRDIRGTKAQGYKDGILEITRRNAEATVRTAISHTANAARSELFQQNEDLVKGVQWVSTLDGRTSAVCRGRDSQVYMLGKGPRPPAHPNCRSVTIPVLKSWREMGIDIDDLPPDTRASMDGQVAAGQSYSDWLRKKPAAFQDEILGKGKAALFRRGGIDLDRFIDRAGNEYTLDELKAKEAGAWAKAFSS